MLELSNVSFSYSRHLVLNQLSLKLEAGKVHGLIGLNGEGKTTLLNVITSRLKPDSGTVLWKNEPITFKMTGYLESEPYFFPKITGREFLTIFRHKNSSFDFDGWNQIFQLPLNELIETYSSGMKKKLALISLMSLDVPILLLDEPFNNLDLETSLILENLLIQLKESGKTILLTSHILDTLTESCDDIHHLNHKKIVRSYSKTDFDDIKKVLISEKIELSAKQISSLIK